MSSQTKPSSPAPSQKRAKQKRSAAPSVATIDPSALVWSAISGILTHTRPGSSALTDGQMVRWHDEGWRFGRLLAVNNKGIARVMQKHGYPPRPQYRFIRLDELEEA